MIYFAIMENKVKLLIIRFSSIGDIVLTTPVIRCLKEQLEGDVEIHYLTKKGYVELLNHNPHLTKVYGIEKTTNEVIEELKKEQFDYIIDLHKNLRSARVKKNLKGLAFSFDKLNFKKWLLVNFKINLLPDVHIVDRYLNTVKALGVENDGLGLDYYLPKGIEEEKLLPDGFEGIYITIVLGANHATKKVPLHKLKSLIEQIQQPIVLIGGEADKMWGEELEQMNPKRIFNACGKMSLNQSAYLLKNSREVITPDTGMMHIAAAFNKNITSIWGNTVPHFGMFPYLKQNSKSISKIVEVKDLNCRPCSKIGFEKCPKGHFKCMEEIPVRSIVKE